MKKILLCCYVLLLMNLSVVSAEQSQIMVDGEYYWWGNKNYIVQPLSSGSSGRYVALDLTSIAIKENTNEKLIMSMLAYHISPNGDIEDKDIFTLKKEKKFNGYFEVNNRKEIITPLIINSYYGFTKEIERHTNNKVNSVDIFDGYVSKNDKYIWLMPKMPKHVDSEYTHEGMLSVVDFVFPKYMQKDLSSEMVICPMYMYYVHGIGKKDVFEVKADTLYAKTLDGRWVISKKQNIKDFTETKGLSNRDNWDEIPFGVLGEIEKDVCDFSYRYVKTGKY